MCVGSVCGWVGVVCVWADDLQCLSQSEKSAGLLLHRLLILQGISHCNKSAVQIPGIAYSGLLFLSWNPYFNNYVK